MHQLLTRQINADVMRSRLRILTQPSNELLTGGFRHPVTDLNDDACLFRQGDKIIGWHEPSFRVLPTNQRLDAFHGTRVKVDDRLIDQSKLFQLYGSSQVTIELPTRLCTVAHLVMEHLKTTAYRFFCFVHCDIGVAHYFVRGFILPGARDDADTRVQIECSPIDFVRLEQLHQNSIRNLSDVDRYRNAV